MSHIETGSIGEEIAVNYLKDSDFIIIERNYRERWGEIDIIAKDPAGILTFVEVKTMRDGRMRLAVLEVGSDGSAREVFSMWLEG